MPRPKPETPRDKLVNVRYSQEERDRLSACAALVNRAVADWLRELSLAMCVAVEANHGKLDHETITRLTTPNPKTPAQLSDSKRKARLKEKVMATAIDKQDNTADIQPSENSVTIESNGNITNVTDTPVDTTRIRSSEGSGDNPKSEIRENSAQSVHPGDGIAEDDAVFLERLRQELGDDSPLLSGLLTNTDADSQEE